VKARRSVPSGDYQALAYGRKVLGKDVAGARQQSKIALVHEQDPGAAVGGLSPLKGVPRMENSGSVSPNAAPFFPAATPTS
jgi:hypothetical protein